MQTDKNKQGIINICDHIGNTPFVRLKDYCSNSVYIKMEGCNVFGSAKDRAAYYVLSKLLMEGTINKTTEIIESSSGNMAVGLAAVGKQLGIPVKIVIDESISNINEFLIKSYGAGTIKVTDSDENGSFLSTRLETVFSYVREHENTYWFNQYGNPLVREAYENTIGKEIAEEAEDADYIFVAVSSGGTIAGISAAVKKVNPFIQVIAVDIEGSKIFDNTTNIKKNFTGIGSSIVSVNIKKADFDDYVIVSEEESISELKYLLHEEQVFAGESTGSVLAGLKKYIRDHNLEGKKHIFISHDRGERYFDMLYSQKIYMEGHC